MAALLPNVDFDFAAADAAATACRDLARRLDALLAARADGRAHATDGWSGGLLDAFTTVHGELVREGTDLHEHLLRTAADIEASADAAAAENARRERENERRLEEERRQRAAAAAAREEDGTSGWGPRPGGPR